jgi:two-component system, cell cycle response regulator
MNEKMYEQAISGKSRILCVDDEAIVRLTLESLLMDERVELFFAENGQAGLDKAREFLPDAILLDVMMPGMDGYEVCRQLRSDPDLAEVPIVMITALDSQEARLEGLAAGADDFLSKPFNSVEIQIRINNILRLNRYRSLVSERARFTWMVDHSEDGYLTLDEMNNIQYANPRASLMLQLEEGQEHGNFINSVEQHFHVEPVEAWEKWAEKPAPCYLVQPETSTSPASWLLMNAVDTPLGKNSHRIVQLQDVTNKILRDLDMRKSHAVISHKLRTPASQIMISLELLADLVKDNDRASAIAFIETARVGGEKLIREITSILDYIDAPILKSGEKALPLQDVADLAREVANCHELAGFSICLPEELASRKVKISREAMDLILHELVENAIKFHPRHEPHVELEFVEAGTGKIGIHISDNGLTLTAWQLQAVWQPYFQGEKHFTGEAPGIGLGLPTVASLVWQEEGRVRLDNRKPGPGIRVEIVLPSNG